MIQFLREYKVLLGGVALILGGHGAWVWLQEQPGIHRGDKRSRYPWMDLPKLFKPKKDE